MVLLLMNRSYVSTCCIRKQISTIKWFNWVKSSERFASVEEESDIISSWHRRRVINRSNKKEHCLSVSTLIAWKRSEATFNRDVAVPIDPPTNLLTVSDVGEMSSISFAEEFKRFFNASTNTNESLVGILAVEFSDNPFYFSLFFFKSKKKPSYLYWYIPIGFFPLLNCTNKRQSE